MSAFRDIAGQVFGRLTVRERGPNRGKKTTWVCDCSCGSTKTVASWDLSSGDTKSCGCLGREASRGRILKDLTGMHFGRLLAIKPGPSRTWRDRYITTWVCACSCGQEHTVDTASLLSGNTKSCGCLRSEVMRHRTGENCPAYIDGRSTVNERARRCARMRDMRKACFTRDNYTCQTCGVRGGTLNADHIKRWSDYPKLRFELSNLRTLCGGCHRKTSTYGNRKNTIDDQ